MHGNPIFINASIHTHTHNIEKGKIEKKNKERLCIIKSFCYLCRNFDVYKNKLNILFSTDISPMNKILRILLLFFSCISCLTIDATDYVFRHLTSEQGLPHQQVEDLCQDQQGNIWMGTRNGLARYDGYTIKSYYHDNGNPNSLIHNYVRHLFLDKDGNLWVLAENDVCRYRPETDDFQCYKFGCAITSMVQTSKGKIICGGDRLYIYDKKAGKFTKYPSIEKGNIVSLAIDNKDSLFVATNNTIYRYDPSLTNIRDIHHKLLSEFLTGAEAIAPMSFDSRNNLWIGMNGKGILRISEKGVIKVFPANIISNGIVRYITEDKQHNIWVATEKGITVISPDDKIDIIRSSFGDDSKLSDNAVYSILCDKNGNIWVGSYFGGVDILQQRDKLFKSYKPGYDTGKIQGKVARSIAETAPGIFWIATEDGGVNICNTASSSFTHFTNIPDLGTNVHTLFYDKDVHNMWIGTFRNGLFRYNLNTGSVERYNQKGIPSIASVFGLVRQYNGTLWAATTQGLCYYDTKGDVFKKIANKQLSMDFIYTLFVDHNDNLWIGTKSNGLYFRDNKTGKISGWQHSNDNSPLLDNFITCIYEDKKGNIWFGTNNNGVQYLDASRKNVLKFGNTILPQKSCICSINGDKDGNLWISTSQGLYRYSASDKTMTRYSTDDGLPTNQFNFASSLLTSNGDLLFGTVKGLVSFSPKAMNSRKSSLKIYLKNLTINNVEYIAATDGSPLKCNISMADEITLSYDQAKAFSLEFGVIEPGANASIDYQVKIDGFDKTWCDVGNDRKLMGYNMAPGKYTVHIRANNSYGRWEDCQVKDFKLIVRPPFYRTIWAYLVYILALAGIVYFFARVQHRRQKAQEAVRIAEMEKEQLKQLDQAKFDFFTAVSHELKTPLSLIMAPLKLLNKQITNDESRKNLNIAIKNTKKMESLINQLVTFNKIETDKFPFYVQKGNPLEFISLNVIPFRELAREKQITLSIDCENNGEDVWFSPSYVEKILNNLLTNAIKFTPQDGSVKVKASIVSNDDDHQTYLKFSVADTGIGISPEELKNIWGRFYQTKRGFNMNSSGWGIGLALVQRLVTVHKGDISVESKLEEGTTFTVLLNVSDKAFAPSSYITEEKVLVPISEYKFSLSMNDLAANNAEESKVKEMEDGKMTILIVDDNEDLLSFLSTYFSREYNVLLARNGREALQIAHNESIQLVVSDVMMPEMDGVELCKSLKGDMETSHIPVILLTAKSEPDDVVEGYRSGAESYVSKPFEPEILELQIKNIISLQKIRQVEIANSQEIDVSTSTLTDLDKKFIKDINDIIDENIGNSDLSISTVTDSLGISRSLLHTKMRSLMDMSMGDFIRKKRLDKACQLLRSTHSVSESAYGSGFSDPNYFSKVFKKYIGISPTEYIVSPPGSDNHTGENP